ncbi:hypothetical protein JOC75_002859 [Metabacillus crassostreae]|uniref:hypothetical protein n=1 Tax=Metabacillus crassostreae TaxID=929098 RepID=UPI00195A38C3|nr:hypothetical protein [Metabacillus crassostreae]MBM7604855.1 hypothetical protein [Metabacillus crassostreae]
MATRKNDAAWLEAKKQCWLNQNDIQMAKELGMSPKQQWKAPVKDWIHDLYEKLFGSFKK